MSGFENDVMVAANVNFNNSGPKPHLGIINGDGELLIGATTAPFLRAGNLTSTSGTLTITNGAGTINLETNPAFSAIEKVAVQTGTTPIVPSSGIITINGATVVAGTHPVRTDGTGANTLAVEVQTSQAIAATDTTKIGLSAFDSAAFDVDANGFVQLNGGGIASTSFPIQANTAPGTNPVVPTTAGAVTINGAAVANHSVVLETRSRAANTYNLEVQYTAAAAATDATKSGVAHFDSADFTVDANGFVSAEATGFIKTLTGDSGGARSPTANNMNIIGGTVAAGTSPLKVAGAASTLTINAQISQAIASTDATKIGLASFNSSDFSVDANGFVTIVSGGFAWNNVTTTSATMAKENGYQANNGGLVTLTMPSVASSTFGDTIKIAGFGSGGWLIQCVATQLIHLGSSPTTAAGSLASTNRYDQIELVCSSTTTEWFVRYSVGNITVA